MYQSEKRTELFEKCTKIYAVYVHMYLSEIIDFLDIFLVIMSNLYFRFYSLHLDCQSSSAPYISSHEKAATQ